MVEHNCYLRCAAAEKGFCYYDQSKDYSKTKIKTRTKTHSGKGECHDSDWNLSLKTYLVNIANVILTRVIFAILAIL